MRESRFGTSHTEHRRNDILEEPANTPSVVRTFEDDENLEAPCNERQRANEQRIQRKRVLLVGDSTSSLARSNKRHESPEIDNRSNGLSVESLGLKTLFFL